MTARKPRQDVPKLYAILGVEPGATIEEIRAAYRDKVRSVHPDTGGTIDAFTELKHAADVLSDTERRKKYDETGDHADGKDLRGPAREMLGKVIEQMIKEMTNNGAEPKDLDFVAATIENLETIKRLQRDAIKKGESIATRWRQVINRTERKEGDNVFADAARFRLKHVESELLRGAEQLQILDVAIALADDHTFRFEEPEAQQPPAWGNLGFHFVIHRDPIFGGGTST